jgi:S1-C subfamily serine protease
LGSPELQEQISRYRPGDVVEVEVDRKGSRKVFDVKLGTMEPDAKRVGEASFWASVGADLEKLSDKELERFKIRSGVRVNKLHEGEFKKAGMPEGYIITKINRSRVRDVADVKNYLQIIEKAEEGEKGVFIEGLLPNGRYEFFTYKK